MAKICFSIFVNSREGTDIKTLLRNVFGSLQRNFYLLEKEQKV